MLAGRVECGKDQTSCAQEVIVPSAAMEASSRTSMALDQGAHTISSSCVQCTRTVRPGIARASSAASSATSSAPLWP